MFWIVVLAALILAGWAIWRWFEVRRLNALSVALGAATPTSRLQKPEDELENVYVAGLGSSVVAELRLAWAFDVFAKANNDWSTARQRLLGAYYRAVRARLNRFAGAKRGYKNAFRGVRCAAKQALANR